MAVEKKNIVYRRMQRLVERMSKEKKYETSYANVMRFHGHAAKWGVQVLNVITARDSLIVAFYVYVYESLVPCEHEKCDKRGECCVLIKNFHF